MQKKKLVIIPGWGGSHESWQDFVDLAQSDFDVSVIDLPCFGEEPCPKEVWGVEEYADFVKSKLEGQKSDVLLGHSFGGQVTAYLVANNPSVCSRLILSGAAIIRPKITLKRKIFRTFAVIGKKVFDLPVLMKFKKGAKKILYRAASSPDYMETSGIKRDIYKKVIRQDVSGVLKKIRTRTLVVWGGKDSYVPLRYGKRIVESIPHAEFKIYKDGRHGLHKQRPKDLLQDIINFA